METKDAFIVVLQRLEQASAGRVAAERAEQRLERERDSLSRTLITAQEGSRRRDKDMLAAEAKIAEWAEYASQLRAAINAIDPTALKRKRIVLPDMPKPFETEIPF